MKNKETWKKKKIRKSKIKNIVAYILIAIIYVIFVYNVIFLLNTTITKRNYLSIFGISLLINDSKAMEDELRKNEVIIAKKVKEEDLNINDIIVSNIKGNIKINRIINIDNESGNKKFVTKFDVNFQPEIEEPTIEKIIGKKVGGIKGLGVFLKIAQSKVTTVIMCIFLILNYNRLKRLERKRIKRKN